MFPQPTRNCHVGKALIRMLRINGHCCKLTKSEANVSEIEALRIHG